MKRLQQITKIFDVKKSLMLVCLALLPIFSQGQTAIKKLTLHDAILLALRFSPEIQNAEIDRVAQKYDLKAANYEFQWQYDTSGNGNYTRQKSGGVFLPNSQNYNLTHSASKKGPFGTEVTASLEHQYDGTNYNPALSLEIRQPLWRGSGETVVQTNLRNAIDDEEINKLVLKENIANAIRTIIGDYRNLILENNNVLIARNALRDAVKTFEDNKIQIDAGRLPRTVNIQQALQVETLKLRLMQALNTRSQIRYKLLEDIGLESSVNIIIPSDIAVNQIQTPDLNKTLKFALANNITLQKNFISLKKDKRSLVSAADKLRPQLDLTATATTGNGVGSGMNAGFNSLTNGQNLSQVLALQLQVPIDDVPLKAALVRAKVELQKAENNINAQRRQLITTIRNQITNIKSQSQQLVIAEESVKLAAQNYELEKEKQRFGRSSSLNVAQTQDSLLQAQNSLISAKIAYLNAISDLQVVLGTLLDTWEIKLKY